MLVMGDYLSRSSEWAEVEVFRDSGDVVPDGREVLGSGVMEVVIPAEGASGVRCSMWAMIKEVGKQVA
jgi:hypothetical protein